MTFKEFYLKESPDRIESNKTDWFQKKDAYPFGFFQGKFYFDRSCAGKSHYDLLEHFLKKGDKDIADYVQKHDGYLDSTKMTTHGRFWLGSQTMSFWDYPPSKLFLLRITSLLKRFGVPIDDHKWKIELANGEIVPIMEYKTTEAKENSMKQIDHILDPIAKQALKNSRPIPGSVHKYQKVVPKDWSIAKYNYMTKSESLEESNPEEYQKTKVMIKTWIKEKNTLIFNSEMYAPIGEWKIRKVDDDWVYIEKGKKRLKFPYDSILRGIVSYVNGDNRYIAVKEHLKNKVNENVPTSVAPSSTSTGQFQSKLGDVAKRPEPKLITNIKDKVKKKLKDKNNLSKYLKP